MRLSQLYALSPVSRHVDKRVALDELIHVPVEDVFVQWLCSPEKFRISFANKSFALCSSYPEAAIVPKSISDEDLKKVPQLFKATLILSLQAHVHHC